MQKLFCAILFVCFSITAISQNKSFNIGYLLDRTSPEIEGLLDELTKEISAVTGEDATLNFPSSSQLVNNFNTQLALQHYNTLLNNDTDIIIAFGVVNNAVISKIGSYSKPTIMFGALSEELIDTERIEQKIENYTSITTSQSYAEDLRTFQQLVNPSKVGVVIEKAFIENLPLAETFLEIDRELDIETKLIPFDNLNDITSNLDEIDGVYLAGGFYLSDAEMKTLAEVFIEKKLPSFTANPAKDVDNGILATNHDQSEMNQFFRRIALTVEAVVNGEDLSRLTSKLESKGQLTINFNTAERIDMPLKYSLIATTTFIGDPDIIAADRTY
ncbi:MAG: hypothetical protein JJ936_05685, partial [Psychroserpens sp.]|nr:hypothetical protein [Psychroserpens sp.]